MTKNKFYIFVFHAVCWILVALPSVVFVPEHVGREPVLYALRLCFPLFLCVIFYVNYLWLVPGFFLNKRLKVYVIINVVLAVLSAMGMDLLMDVIHRIEIAAGYPPPPRREAVPFVVIALKNVIPFMLSAVLALLLRLALKWQATEAARKEMEIQKTEAELKNLQSQINPHFLLNTLNNIYALISFDSDKAQKAVLSLGALLRQMLHGERNSSTSLREEADFIRNYVDLMRLRLNKNVKIDLNVDVNCGDDVRVAPFIFISLVENAFKHGVSTTLPSFISINIMSDGNKIVCEIKNSNFPKNDSDKSGHGIGLEQVARRLDLSYAGKYEWQRGTDEQNKVYFSKITIYDTKLCDNR